MRILSPAGTSVLKPSAVTDLAHPDVAAFRARLAAKGAWRDGVVGQGDGIALTKDKGEVDAISGATITSRAVVTQIQNVIDAVNMLG